MPGSHYHDDDDDDDQVTQSTIRVIAPATLNEGYAFDVLVDGNPYSVQVPPGGVKEGQEFVVPYDPRRSSVGDDYREEDEEEDDYRQDREKDDAMTQPIQTMSTEEDEEDDEDKKEEEDEDKDVIWYDETTGAPIGGWRTPLCSCCDVVTQSTFWMALCCTPVIIAQLITRLGLTWNGRPGPPEETSLSFNRILLSMMIALGIWKIPLLGGVVLLAYVLFIVVYVGSRVRAHVRQKYKIPASLPGYCGGERFDDGCCMLWCGCCSSIQMARHTHDDKDYPGHGCTTTGLGFDAPEIV